MADVIGDCREALANVDMGKVYKNAAALKRAAQVFVIGNGGGAAHASHFAADLRKICKLRAFAFDSIPEMTARINDDGWDQAWYDWRTSLNYRPGEDVTFVFSVGGGLDGTSHNLPDAVYGIVGPKGRFAERIVVENWDTSVIEGCQAVIAHELIERCR